RAAAGRPSPVIVTPGRLPGRTARAGPGTAVAGRRSRAARPRTSRWPPAGRRGGSGTVSAGSLAEGPRDRGLGLVGGGAGVVQQGADAAQGLDHLLGALVVLLPQGVELPGRLACPLGADQPGQLRVQALLDALDVTGTGVDGGGIAVQRLRGDLDACDH